MSPVLTETFSHILGSGICTIDNHRFSSARRPWRPGTSLFPQFHPLARTPFSKIYLQFPHSLGILCSTISLDVERFVP